jgi:hypothetical protein
MYCQKCGAQVNDQAVTCEQCGAALSPVISENSIPQKIPNYLAQAILVTLLCCLPLGIPAIVFAAQVNGKIQAGDIAGAQEASRKAKLWCWWSFGVGLGVVILQVLFQVLAIFGAAVAGNSGVH